MITIRASQMESLHLAAVERLASRLMLHFESTGYIGPVRELVDYVLHNAAEFGLSTERELLRLAQSLAAWVVPPQSAIELPPPALSILLRYGMDPDQKLRRFENWVRENAV